MRLIRFFAVPVAFILAPTLHAAESAPAAGKPRELLQPPKTTIASPITDRLAIRGIFYSPQISTDLRNDASTGAAGTPISAEDTLAMQDRMQQGGIDLMFRMLDRHRIRVAFYKQTRS